MHLWQRTRHALIGSLRFRVQRRMHAFIDTAVLCVCVYVCMLVGGRTQPTAGSLLHTHTHPTRHYCNVHTTPQATPCNSTRPRPTPPPPLLLPACYPMSGRNSVSRSAPEWNAVEVLRAGPNPRWKCKSCSTNYTGAPRRIAQHILGVSRVHRESDRRWRFKLPPPAHIMLRLCARTGVPS